MNLFAGILGLVLVAFAPVAYAQDSDPEALSLMKSLLERYEAFNDMSMNFELQIKDLEVDVEEVRNGTLQIQGQKFRIEMDSQVIITNNSILWTYLQDVNEVQINYYDEEDEDFITPSELFSLDMDEFFVSLGNHLVDNGKKIQIVELSPLDKNLSYHTIQLYVDIKSKGIVQGRILEKDGIHISYIVSDFKSNQKLPDETFKFDPDQYPGIEVIDLR